MTDKELQKLGRRDLLQLLLDQAKETDRLSRLLRDTEEQLSRTEEGYERLRERLDHKDARIHELQDQINQLQSSIQDEKEKRIADLSEVGSIAEAALRLNGVFDAAQRAANQYLQSVKELYAIPEGMEAPIEMEPEPEWGYQESYPPEPPRARPPEPGRYRTTDPPPRPRQYPPEEPEPEPEPEGRAAGQERERRAGKREAPSQSKLPFRVKKRKETGKTTLFFGWQHD